MLPSWDWETGSVRLGVGEREAAAMSKQIELRSLALPRLNVRRTGEDDERNHYGTGHVAFDYLELSHGQMEMILSLLVLSFEEAEGCSYVWTKNRNHLQAPEGKIPWFYYPPRSRNPKRFGTFADLIGLVSAIYQCIVTVLNYDFARRAANSPIEFPLLPIICACGLLCSIIVQTVEKRASDGKDS
ncbi:hypothetical protein SLEP1_g40804 [Rubroshorea leprosula]|uniref:Uncharacterized protein n=1 Tax=Rubroshorea leprosula TaxID=152421 RepID=A0AAV5L525_9ROSI|nr:hypothetical protein SLEP1_g40804 [Rubroshorea leprosula]